jgi:PPOX class probable F420-dependent enzyme
MSVLDRVERASSRFYDAIRSSKARDAEATVSGFGHLAGHKYALLVTYKRSGEAVPTPVWFGVDEQGRLYARTGRLAAKAKRIRNNPRVRVAPCTVRGVPRGPYAEGTARVCDDAEHDHAETAIHSNYGLGRKVYEGSAGSMEAFYIEVAPAGGAAERDTPREDAPDFGQESA